MKPKLNYSLINKDWNCKVYGFNLQVSLFEDLLYIDLTLKENGEIRILRFLKPSQIEMESRYSANEQGFEMIDCSGDGMEFVNLRVSGAVDGLGNFSFWAQNVVEIFS